MGKHRIGLIGGTGFVGRHVVHRLARDGHYLRVLTRRRERHRDLLVVPTLELVETDAHYASNLAETLKGCDALVNLVGILNEGRGEHATFRAVHVDLPRKVVEAARFNGIGRLLHMSALNADPAGPSAYLRSKGEGEAIAHEAAREGIAVTSFRPSVIFGPGDSLLNRFAQLLRLAPVLPLACPGARFAPLYVGDLAEAVARALEDPATHGRRYELCGPEVITLRDLVAYTARVTGRRRLILGLGDAASRLQARVMQHLPGTPFSYDNYLSLKQDSVCREDGLAALGITPTGMSSVVPGYLGTRTRARFYDDLRAVAGRG
jgi:NADH dehydrogenase